MYVLQFRAHEWDPWEACHKRYPTLEEAQARYNGLLDKSAYRIAEEYTVTRYKAVKA